MIAVGQRVRVAIVDRDKYSTDYAEALDGLTGVIEDTNPNSSNGDPFPGLAHLVLFDTPPLDPSSTAPRGRKLTCFWFAPTDLQFSGERFDST